MLAKKDCTGSERLPKEPDGLIRSQDHIPAGPKELISIRRAEIISIAPDSINWDNIYSGKTAGLQSIKPTTWASRKEVS